MTELAQKCASFSMPQFYCTATCAKFMAEMHAGNWPECNKTEMFTIPSGDSYPFTLISPPHSPAKYVEVCGFPPATYGNWTCGPKMTESCVSFTEPSTYCTENCAAFLCMGHSAGWSGCDMNSLYTLTSGAQIPFSQAVGFHSASVYPETCSGFSSCNFTEFDYAKMNQNSSAPTPTSSASSASSSTTPAPATSPSAASPSPSAASPSAALVASPTITTSNAGFYSAFVLLALTTLCVS